MKEIEIGDIYDVLHEHLRGCKIEGNEDGQYEVLVRVCAAGVLNGSTADLLGEESRYRVWCHIRDLLDDCNMEEVPVMEVVRNAVQYAAKKLGVELDANGVSA